MDGDPADFRLADAPVEAAGEVARLDWRAETGGEHQSGVDPAVAGLFPSGVLLLHAELEGGHTQVGGSGASDPSVLVGRRRSWRPTAWSCSRTCCSAASGMTIPRYGP